MKFSVNVSCEIICENSVKNIISVGEKLALNDDVQVRLEDITADEKKYALVTLIIGKEEKRLVIEEGKKVKALPYPYIIGVSKIGPGYTFAGKWAEIELAQICHDL